VLIDVASFDPIGAETPLKVSEVAPLSVVPKTVTAAPAGALAGANPEIFAVTLKTAVLLAVPSSVRTWIVPVVAPAGTTAFSELGPTNVTVTAAVPLNLTVGAPRKPEPLMVTVVAPGSPRPRSTGAGATNGNSRSTR
jgi:hypothetical protein